MDPITALTSAKGRSVLGAEGLKLETKRKMSGLAHPSDGTTPYTDGASNEPRALRSITPP
jgi:hypothetical protein